MLGGLCFALLVAAVWAQGGFNEISDFQKFKVDFTTPTLVKKYVASYSLPNSPVTQLDVTGDDPHSPSYCDEGPCLISSLYGLGIASNDTFSGPVQNSLFVNDGESVTFSFGGLPFYSNASVFYARGARFYVPSNTTGSVAITFTVITDSVSPAPLLNCKFPTFPIPKACSGPRAVTPDDFPPKVTVELDMTEDHDNVTLIGTAIANTTFIYNISWTKSKGAVTIAVYDKPPKNIEPKSIWMRELQFTPSKDTSFPVLSVEWYQTSPNAWVLRNLVPYFIFVGILAGICIIAALLIIAMLILDFVWNKRALRSERKRAAANKKLVPGDEQAPEEEEEKDE